MNKRNCVRHILHTRFHTKMCNKENIVIIKMAALREPNWKSYVTSQLKKRNKLQCESFISLIQTRMSYFLMELLINVSLNDNMLKNSNPCVRSVSLTDDASVSQFPLA